MNHKNRHTATALFRPDYLWNLLEAIANIHAPSQTITYTRLPVIQRLWQAKAQGAYKFVTNYANTGNAVLFLGEQQPARLLISAHADEFSYLVGPTPDENGWPLIPYCSDRTQIDYAAVALRYQLASRQLDVVAKGTIHRVGPERYPYFIADEGQVAPGDRLVYTHPLSRDGDLVYGSLDDAAGVAACLLAMLALSQLDSLPAVALAITDEEEGPPDLNAAFARGARRLNRNLPQPDICLVVDGQNASPTCRLGGGAVFAEKSSGGKGVVTPPHLYARMQALAAEMADLGVRLVENPGYVSRSDDVAYMEVMSDIFLLGFPLANAHFNQAPPSASLNDILHLAQAIFWTALEFV